MNKNRVIVAMSGGVDSSVAAAILKKEGYDVIGITMKTWGFMEVGGAPKHESGCCSLDAIFDAKNVAELIGIPHYTVDFTKAFEKAVIDDFVNEYLSGRTPNPCVVCNRKIKWEELLKKADSLDAQYVATGHYALVEKINNRFTLKYSKDHKKDQTYALWGLTQESLSRTLFPLGKYTKEEVRSIAADFGLKTASKPDSQEICFVADNNYERFLRERIPEVVNEIHEGNLVYHGQVVGKHKGFPFYTIGQRRGLGVSFGKPVYVKKIDNETNTIEIGDKEELLKKYVKASDINYVSRPSLNKGEKVFGKIRYSDTAKEAVVLKSSQDTIEIEFLEPKNAVTPGQSLVLYDSDGYLLAGGIIDK
ncbi:tRNA 2-thiouridine(34) synthase MnmA [Melioribacter sp. OK-6-Me]|uniref:tRNA 2-thiouridine(34) synthase MnmA n=1 Tax=unclassified Melioribacter TaxID=2627329 RepID=UPI003EDABA5A